MNLGVFGFFAFLMVISKTAGQGWALAILSVPVAYQVAHRLITGDWVE